MRIRSIALVLLAFALGVLTGHRTAAWTARPEAAVPVGAVPAAMPASLEAGDVTFDPAREPMPEGLTEEERRNIRIFREASRAETP